MSKDRTKKEYQKTPSVADRSHIMSKREFLLGLFLIVITFISYYPSLNGQPLWDDAGHINRPELQSPSGFVKIWTKPGATQQYYPLVHSIFWLEYHFWGDSTTGYHLINLLLHLLSAFLLIKILRYLRLSETASWLAGAIFALHPVQVETVAQMSELKNTLSGVFFLSSALMYLKYSEERNLRKYCLSLIFFILGLLSKSVIATLPVSLLAVIWWKKGQISLKKDFAPLTPFFVLGISSGLFTAWVEQHFIIAGEKDNFNLSLVERCLIAGRVGWFYLGKILLPINLTFCYPRWLISQTVWWQYLYPVATVCLAIVFWTFRKRRRAPLTIFICFFSSLFPVMGFLNVYPFRFSFVADHYQYLACIYPIVGLSGLICCSAKVPNKFLRQIMVLALFATLSILVWRQSSTYATAVGLYQDTIRKNPQSWLAYNNLGVEIAQSGRLEDAIACFQKALSLNPSYGDAYYNLASGYSLSGQTNAAIEQYQKALENHTRYQDVYYNLGLLLESIGRVDEAAIQYKRAIEIDPADKDARDKLGMLLEKK